MKIVRNDKKIADMNRLIRITSLAGLGLLLTGFFTSLIGQGRYLFLQWVALMLGILLWQVSKNFMQKFGRNPRTDLVLDEALQAAVPSSTLYHYVLPADHVLLTRSGPIILVPFVQSGEFTVSGENGDVWKWNKNIFQRWIGQESRLHNPTRDGEAQLDALVKFIKEKAPDLQEIPLGVILIFISPRAQLTVQKTRLPVLLRDEAKNYIRKHTGRALDKAVLTRLREIFEGEATGMVESGSAESTEENAP